MAPNSGAPSSTRTGHPRCASASAVVSPPSPPPTIRMGCFIATASLGRLHRPDPFDLPLELDARALLDALAHGLAQHLDVGGGGAPKIDEKIAVHLRHLGIADLEAATAGGVDQLPGFMTLRVLEGRAAGPAL